MGKTFKDSTYSKIRKPMARQGQRFESKRAELREAADRNDWDDYLDYDDLDTARRNLNR